MKKKIDFLTKCEQIHSLLCTRLDKKSCKTNLCSVDSNSVDTALFQILKNALTIKTSLRFFLDML